jgi:hypothetical protein
VDDYLDDAWQSAVPPFDGLTLHNELALSPKKLLAVLEAIVVNLEQQYGRGQRLLDLQDWHEHDGFRREGNVASFAIVRKMIETEPRLLATRTGDHRVYRAIYPTSGEWLLRWCISDDDTPECDVTFSTNESDANAMAARLKPLMGVAVEESAGYFRRAYAG